ncbi:MAG: multidrug efflux SMR transporter [Chloroflexi bacterium]|nr:multidrug efflux SMR transporter [Chloroflexota bacterium]
MSLKTAYLLLLLAVMAETAATSALKASAQFTRLLPSLVVVGGYGASFYLLTLVLKRLPLGLTYALWSGLGVVLVTVAGMVLYREKPDLPALVGLALIVAGIMVVNLWSGMVVH